MSERMGTTMLCHATFLTEVPSTLWIHQAMSNTTAIILFERIHMQHPAGVRGDRQSQICIRISSQGRYTNQSICNLDTFPQFSANCRHVEPLRTRLIRNITHNRQHLVITRTKIRTGNTVTGDQFDNLLLIHLSPKTPGH